MPMFEISNNKLLPIELKNFSLERHLQSLVEGNLKEVFDCRLVASEFLTGAQHAGRIDSLALSEEDNPVIVEYKKVKSLGLTTQSLFYLHWLQDHKGDFEIAVQKALGNDVKVDWSDIRVICIAPGYTKYDLHAVQEMGANIELWKYHLFSNNTLYFEEVLHPSSLSAVSPSLNKKRDMVKEGKEAVRVRTYTFEEQHEGKSKVIQELMDDIREFVMGLDSAIKEIPRKHYIAYRSSQNIVCVESKNRYIRLFVKLKPSEVPEPPGNYRDVSAVGHMGTGDAEFTISTHEEFKEVKKYIELVYRPSNNGYNEGIFFH